MASPVNDRSRGWVSALSAYLAWGLFPLYFKALAGVPALEVLAHRVLWSVALLVPVVVLLRRGATVWSALRAWRRLAAVASATLIAVNWLVYIWAVQVGRVVEASLGYFVNPLVSVLLGVVFLRERLRRTQAIAVGLAGLGVLWLVVQLGVVPWLPLTLALSFGLYGLVRKRAAMDPIGGLLAETALLGPAALAFVLWRGAAGTGAFGHGVGGSLLLAAAGPITTVPLVLFADGVRRLPLSTVGLLQYLTPTLQFMLGVVVYREPFTHTHAVTFACIWSALGLYTWDTLRRAAGRPAEAPEPEP
jgi:chloramphenicol-sensitive protein RarD